MYSPTRCEVPYGKVLVFDEHCVCGKYLYAICLVHFLGSRKKNSEKIDSICISVTYL